MERLTKQINNKYWVERDTLAVDYIPQTEMCSGGKVINKLGQLEDIEQELGIDLITFLQSLTKNVFIKQGNKIIECETPPILLNFDGEYYFEWHCEKLNDSFEQLPLKDYGKTWALTKEGLEWN